MIFNNPNNPTGKVFSAEEMRDAADFVKKHDLLAISDEAYDRLLYGDARHLSLAAEPDMRERTLLVGSLSKTYSMTGWRLGYVAGAPELIERLARLQQNYMLSVTSFAQYGGAEALNGPQECVETMRKAFEERRKVLIEGLTGRAEYPFQQPRRRVLPVYRPPRHRPRLGDVLASGSSRNSLWPACRRRLRPVRRRPYPHFLRHQHGKLRRGRAPYPAPS